MNENELKIVVGSKAPLPKESLSENDIMARWVDFGNAPLISVLVATYNHEKYIKQCLDGILSQKLNVPYELIVRDDSSDDGTLPILIDFSRKYPNIIKLKIENVNTYSKGIRPSEELYKIAMGKYIATCEGDDYWLDDQKLQKQFDALESQPTAYVVTCDAAVVDEKGVVLQAHRGGEGLKLRRDVPSHVLKRGVCYAPTNTRFHRNISIPFSEFPSRVRSFDNLISHYIGQHGSGIFLKEIIPCVYRIHPGGIWSSSPRRRRIDEKIILWKFLFTNNVIKKDLMVALFCARRLLWVYIKKLRVNPI